jgi:hypothetical protein
MRGAGTERRKELSELSNSATLVRCTHGTGRADRTINTLW